MFQIGSWDINAPSVLAPMAGVTDLPFRQLCRSLGAGLAVSEMVTSDSRLWGSRKSQHRLAHGDEGDLCSVQLAGNDPQMMADAARANVEMGAQIIDINMGCPAKKVCKKAAGSALLQDEPLVESILQAVVSAVDVPVTLKIRTGWNEQQRNGVTIAKIAEDCGIQALAVHGRTRACAFKGPVEYETIARIVNAVDIPVIANGDITSAEKAADVLRQTSANAVMVGRGAQGNPWLFREINHFLATGKPLPKPIQPEIVATVAQHIRQLHQYYGEVMGVRIARKHVTWYWQQQPLLRTKVDSCVTTFRQHFNRIESAQEQLDALASYFETLETIEEKAA